MFGFIEMLSLPCLIVVTFHSRCTYYLDGVIVYMSELKRASIVSNHVLLRKWRRERDGVQKREMYKQEWPSLIIRSANVSTFVCMEI